MARKKGQTYTSEQKAKVVLELLKEEQTIGELATQYKVTPKTIQNWKKEFLANASKAFERDKNAKENKEQKIEEEKVEFISEIDRVKKQLPSSFNQLSSIEEYWTAIIALEVVATSCASSDKDFSDKERKEISKFIYTINEDMPSEVKEKINDLYRNPLPFNKAFLLANESKLEMSIFEELLDLIIHVDGVKFEEKVILNAWHDFKRAA